MNIVKLPKKEMLKHMKHSYYLNLLYGQVNARILLGECLPTNKQNAVKIRVQTLRMNEKIHLYFHEEKFYYAHDPEKKCKTGDIVLIQDLTEKISRLLTHKIIDVIYPLGDVTDPITGKKVAGPEYREDQEIRSKLFGVSKAAFDYNNAPPRGRLEDIKDFTRKKIYTKYHDDPKNPDGYAVRRGFIFEH